MPLQAQDPFAGPTDGLGGHFEGDAAGHPEHQKALVSLPIQPSHTNLFVSTDAAAADQREMELDCLNWEREMGHTAFIIPQAVLNYGPIHNLEIVGEFAASQPTDFALDVLGRSVCNTFDEARQLGSCT